MANTPKKKNAGSSAKSGSKRRSAPPPPAYNAQARIIGGIVCLLLALCAVVSYFQEEALFITFFGGLLKGLLGYGYWMFNLPKVSQYGFWGMAHEARTDFSMILGSIFLLIVGAGSLSLDAFIPRSKRPREG